MKLVRIHYHTEQGENITECCRVYHPDMLALFEEMGIISIEKDTVPYEDMRRLHKIMRIKKQCGANTIGAAIIVDLLERIEKLEDEIERLRKR